MKLSRKVSLVTGAGRGIGRAISLSLAREGSTVVLAARSATDLEKVKNEIESEGGSASIVRADITRAEDLDTLFKHVERQYGRLDILVNNAGIGRFAPVRDLKIDDFDAMWNLNVRGLLLCTQRALRFMESQREGIIVNISSLAGKNAFVNGGGYAATKWALMGFARCLMLEERQFNIRVITVCPGSVDTSFSNHESGVGKTEKILSPEDVAETVLSAITVHPRAMVSEIDIRPTNPK